MAHRLTEVNEETMQAACSQCGPVQIRRQRDPRRPSGYTLQCREKRRAEQRRQSPAREARRAPNPRPHRKHVGSTCERCGFVPEDLCQLQVDHIIPRWKGGTNRRDNLQTLCCNCHALKSKQDLIEWRATTRAAINPAGS